MELLISAAQPWVGLRARLREFSSDCLRGV
jgi:hypothetical protein